MKKTNYIVNILLIFIITGVAIQTMDGSLWAVRFLAWAISPFLLFILIARKVSRRRALIINLIASLIVGVMGVWLIVDAMYINLDAQAGLVFIFVPAWQLIAVLLISVPIYFVNRGGNI